MTKTRVSKIRMSEIRVSKISVSEIRVSEIRVREIRVSEIRVSEIRISSNHRELHGAIFFTVRGFTNDDICVLCVCNACEYGSRNKEVLATHVFFQSLRLSEVWVIWAHLCAQVYERNKKETRASLVSQGLRGGGEAQLPDISAQKLFFSKQKCFGPVSNTCQFSATQLDGDELLRQQKM